MRADVVSSFSLYPYHHTLCQDAVKVSHDRPFRDDKRRLVTSQLQISLRTADVFPVVTSLPPKINVGEPERQNDFRDVEPFVLMLASQIKG